MGRHRFSLGVRAVAGAQGSADVMSEAVYTKMAWEWLNQFGTDYSIMDPVAHDVVSLAALRERCAREGGAPWSAGTGTGNKTVYYPQRESGAAPPSTRGQDDLVALLREHAWSTFSAAPGSLFTRAADRIEQ